MFVCMRQKRQSGADEMVISLVSALRSSKRISSAWKR
jgi:hypothetical protein